jgi:hypothetical protein
MSYKTLQVAVPSQRGGGEMKRAIDFLDPIIAEALPLGEATEQL